MRMGYNALYNYWRRRECFPFRATTEHKKAACCESTPTPPMAVEQQSALLRRTNMFDPATPARRHTLLVGTSFDSSSRRRRPAPSCWTESAVWCSGPSSSWDLHEDGRPLLSEPPRHARCPFHPLSCGPETEQEEGTSINTLEASAYLADDATRELLLGSTCFLRPALPSFECATQRHGPPRRTCTGALGPRHRIRPRGAARVTKYAWHISSLSLLYAKQAPRGCAAAAIGGGDEGERKAPGGRGAGCGNGEGQVATALGAAAGMF